jgi:TolB protein
VSTEGNIATVPLARDIPQLPTATPTPALALQGRLAFTRNVDGGRDGAYEIFRHDLATGTTARLTNNNSNDWLPNWSPDGSRIAFTSHRENSNRSNYDIWVMNADGSNPRRYIATSAWDEYASWSPRNTGEIAFSTTADDNSEIHIGNGSGELRRVTFNPGRDEWPSWSPDGQQIVHSSDYSGSRDIFITGVTDGVSRRLYGTAADENKPVISPDGRWIVFVSRGSERDAYGRLVLINADGSSPQTLTGSDASDPNWSPDSRYIIYSRALDSNSNGQYDEKDESDLWVFDLNTGTTQRVLQEPGAEFAVSWTYAR